MNGFVGFGVGAGSCFGVLDRALVSLEAAGFSAGFSAGFADEVLRPRVGLSGAGAADLDRAASSGYSVYSGRVEVLRPRDGLGVGLGSGLGFGVGLPLGAEATMTCSCFCCCCCCCCCSF